MLSFRLFRIPVEVQPWFWLTAALLGYPLLRKGEYRLLLVWLAVVFVSIVVHELGHALAIRRHRVEPEITLHGLGGTTSWRAVLPIGRLAHIGVSLAGPFAGFALAGVMYLVQRSIEPSWDIPALALWAIDSLISVNFYWGIFNLIPVLPFDGGHVLEHALGPRRARLTAGISFLVAGGLALLAITWNQIWMAMLLGISAIQSFNRFRSEPDVTAGDLDRPRPVPREEPIPGEILALLRRAQRAVAEDRLDEAAALAADVLARDPAAPRPALQKAHEIVGWVRLLGEDVKGATVALAQVKRFGPPDAALAAAVHRALGETRQARKVLEDARAAGDDRKEIVGPLIQILIEQGEVPRAAAHALDIVESLSDDDARKMAEISFDHGAFEWSARLYEAVFRRNGAGEDAYGAARANAKDGNVDRALELLRQAVEAGFSDRDRAWSDAALAPLRDGPLETVLPRP